MYRVLVGFAVGAGLALPIGLAMGASPRVYSWFNPLFQLLRPIPPIAYIPLAMLWFGLGNPPAVFLIALGAFFPVLMNTVAGGKPNRADLFADLESAQQWLDTSLASLASVTESPRQEIELTARALRLASQMATTSIMQVMFFPDRCTSSLYR